MAARTEKLGFGGLLLYLLAALGIVLMIYRFATGIGSVANLNQGYPWGFWIGFDVLAGIALAAGGFVVAGVVHIFGGEKYHALVRPAITTAFLGYLMFILGLLVDLGRPWTIWHMIIFWQHHSPMFEVGWCVMLYTAVLLMEFVPAWFESKGMTGALQTWREITPWIAWFLLTLFTYALTNSVIWMIVIGVVLILFELLIRSGMFKRDPRTPTLLIMAGVIFSTLHQSSLGTLFTMVPHKLSAVWYTPILPVVFFLSAVMAGCAMVIVESTWTSKHFRREPETHLLRGIGKGLSWVIMVYLAVKIVDLVARGAVGEVMVFSMDAIMFWVEIGIGLAIPLAILLSDEGVNSQRGLFWAGLFVVIGIIINRLNVAITGITAPFAENYRPHWMEIAISVGIVAIGILVYRALVIRLPILDEGGHDPAGRSER